MPPKEEFYLNPDAETIAEADKWVKASFGSVERSLYNYFFATLTTPQGQEIFCWLDMRSLTLGDGKIVIPATGDFDYHCKDKLPGIGALLAQNKEFFQRVATTNDEYELIGLKGGGQKGFNVTNMSYRTRENVYAEQLLVQRKDVSGFREKWRGKTIPNGHSMSVTGLVSQFEKQFPGFTVKPLAVESLQK